MPIETLKVVRSSGEIPDKRQEILDVAASFFLSYGYEGSSVNAMARHSGISKESFYRYFRGKDELFKAVLEQELEQYRQNITRLLEHWDEEDMRTTLFKVAQTLMSVIMTDRQQALRRLVFGETKRDPDIGALYYRIGPKLAYESLEKYFELHSADTDFDPAFLSRAFMAMVLHEPMLARNCGVRENPSPEQIVELAGEVVDNFRKGFFKH
jgi:TetR/AcrR family transcriptional repressor of mexJK operon